MAKPGLVFGNGGAPSDLHTRVSAVANDIEDDIAELIEEFLKEAVAEMRGYIASRGVQNGVVNSRGRIGKTGDLYNDVSYKITRLANGRIQAEFGWLNGDPFYALFQEYGTLNYGQKPSPIGIHQMLALTDAYKNFETKMQDAFDNGSIRVLNEGQFSSRAFD